MNDGSGIFIGAAGFVVVVALVAWLDGAMVHWSGLAGAAALILVLLGAAWLCRDWGWAWALAWSVSILMLFGWRCKYAI